MEIKDLLHAINLQCSETQNQTELQSLCNQLIEQVEELNLPIDKIETIVEQLEALGRKLVRTHSECFGIIDQTSFELSQKTMMDESCFSFE